ncbi:helix-turn-helix domain-containing protein [Oricola cellulosilytica]|nr:helix-turn-helix transcriptional regulator [Oricola cellulosilytica]
MQNKSRAARKISKQITKLTGRKSQKDISDQAGFSRPNVLSMLKNDVLKLPLDRVPALAKALECDVGELFSAALEQHYNMETIRSLRAVMTELSANELEWIDFLRKASKNSDPKMTATRQKVLAALLKPSESLPR